VDSVTDPYGRILGFLDRTLNNNILVIAVQVIALSACGLHILAYQGDQLMKNYKDGF
jgi:hypothetical protein